MPPVVSRNALTVSTSSVRKSAWAVHGCTSEVKRDDRTCAEDLSSRICRLAVRAFRPFAWPEMSCLVPRIAPSVFGTGGDVVSRSSRSRLSVRSVLTRRTRAGHEASGPDHHVRPLEKGGRPSRRPFGKGVLLQSEVAGKPSISSVSSRASWGIRSFASLHEWQSFGLGPVASLAAPASSLLPPRRHPSLLLSLAP